MRWFTTAGVACRVQSNGRTLMISLNPDPADHWQSIALEWSSLDDSAEKVLDEHAHAVLTAKPTLREAMDQAEAYAKWWQRNRAPEAAPCECGEIPAPGAT